MRANLFCMACRSIVAIAATVTICTIATAQRIFYSPGERNIPSETKTYIVGNVATNTIIWEYLPSSGKSEILVYDENMRLLSRVKANVFASKSIYQLNFINRQNSFDVIAQAYTGHNYYCQLASFNGNGYLLQHVKTLFTKNLAKTFFGGSYDCAISANKKYFALVKDNVYASTNEIHLDCQLFREGDSLQNIVPKTIIIPYYRDLNTLFSPVSIDNTGNIFFAEYISQAKDSNSHVIVYRCAPSSKDYTSCTADISGKQLNELNIKLDNYNKQCIVYAFWKPKTTFYPAVDGKATGGIFSWAVNDRMESVKKDTSYLLPGLNSMARPRWGEVNFSAKDAVVLHDDTYTLAITATEGRPINMYSPDDNDILSGYYINSASYSPGLFNASNPQVYEKLPSKNPARSVENHSTDYVYNYTSYNYTPKLAAKKRPALPQFKTNLLLMRVDNMGNNIIWSKNISSSHDESAFSYVNNYSLLNTGDALYFICKKFLAKDKESFESIKLDADGNISVRQIMSRNNNYELLVNCGVQVDAHSMIFPCIYQEKTLAFAKYELEE